MLRLERKKFPKKAGRNLLCIYPFAMDTNGSFCDTSIHFLKKIAVVIFSNEPGSEPLLAWKRANWVQETCLLIQNTVLRAASLYFHRGLRKCFANDYMRFFDSPVHSRLDNDVSGRSPTNIQNSCPFRPGCARSLNSLTFFMKEEYVA